MHEMLDTLVVTRVLKAHRRAEVFYRADIIWTMELEMENNW